MFNKPTDEDEIVRSYTAEYITAILHCYLDFCVLRTTEQKIAVNYH